MCRGELAATEPDNKEPRMLMIPSTALRPPFEHGLRRAFGRAPEGLPRAEEGIYLVDHFTSNRGPFEAAGIGGTGGVSVSNADDASGVLILGGSDDGDGAVIGGEGALAFARGPTAVEWRVQLPVWSASDGFLFECGFGTNTLTPPDAVFFVIDPDTYGDLEWRVVTRAGGVSTVEGLGDASPAGAWIRLRADVVPSSSGYAASFSVYDGAVLNGLQRTITTNIPTAYVGPWLRFRKQNGVEGQAAMVDYGEFAQLFL